MILTFICAYGTVVVSNDKFINFNYYKEQGLFCFYVPGRISNHWTFKDFYSISCIPAMSAQVLHLLNFIFGKTYTNFRKKNLNFGKNQCIFRKDTFNLGNVA